MTRKQLVTVYDVARTARVSPATVSRVLNQPENVSRRTRLRVLSVIRQSGFRPNVNARRLANGASAQICFLLGNRALAHSFHSRILQGVADHCKQKHHQVAFTSFEYGADDTLPNENLPVIIRENAGIEGLVVAGTNYPVFLKYIEGLNIPYVLFGNNLLTGSLALPRKNAVCFDEQGGAEAAAELLIELGHRHVTFIGDLSKIWYRRRYRGYGRVMKARKLAPAAVDVQDDPDCFQLGQRAVATMIRKYPKTTAVLAQDDETACGILAGLRKLRIRVPEEISLVGYDDIAEIQYMQPALTTVRVFKEKIGSTMAEELLRLIGGERCRVSPVVIGTELVIRESCAKPRAG